ncbi:poly [ADP-ribose] polymerase tankyrase-like isoform X2 [Lineus longissimus]|uniref:poly [ADP-ribose] polymerase tankyrase-like isoform X2 n=1 Tax=Lineus longissimus TaxID=88925 RepID=UPI00315CDF18
MLLVKDYVWGLTVDRYTDKGRDHLLQLLKLYPDKCFLDLDLPLMMATPETLSSLFEAIKIGDHAALETLLIARPSWVGRTLTGCTLLEAAVHCHAGSLEIIEILLKSGANVNQLSVCFDVMDGSETPLIAAARKVCRKELVVRLVEAGARVNAIDGVAQLSALSYTCIVPPNDKQAVEALGIARVLLENGAEVNGAPGERTPPLHLAVGRADNLAMVKLLISQGADVNQMDYMEQVALHKVISPDVATYLIQNGAILLPQSRYWLHPVEAIIASKDKRLFYVRLELVRLMIQHGVQLNVKMIPEPCRWFYQYYPHWLIKYGAMQLHGPWYPRGEVESATERGWYKIAQYARDFVPGMADDKDSICKRFFWDFRDINERFIADDTKAWIEDLHQQPPRLQDMCTASIRHVLLKNSAGRSIVPAIDSMALPYKLRHLVVRAPPK